VKFVFIGIHDGEAPRFPDGAMAAIAAGRVFSGGRRHRELVGAMLPPGAVWIDIVPPMEAVFEHYSGHGSVVVFASGDPLFFGFAATVRRRLPEAEITIYPAMNSLQTLAHRIAMPYGDMRVVSLTGRPWDELDMALIEGAAKIGILTDHTHTPRAIASRMVDHGYTGYGMVVGSRLGNPTLERVVQTTLEVAADPRAEEFAAPNCVIVHGTPRRASLGIPDSQFELLDGRARMITKMPVRLTALSMLGLERAACLWDIGFCTGSVSIEARLRFPGLKVHAFEIRPEGARLMEINSRRHGAPGIETHIGDFLSADLNALPQPDAIFIGGHGGRLDAVVERGAGLMVPGGRMVFNSVSRDSRAAFEAAVARAGLTIETCTRVAVDDHNPIEILKAVKQ
jgi:precorrin-6Y C5,15-methyltransferase (decarboxylating)